MENLFLQFAISIHFNYYLEEYNGEPILGSFYATELQPVHPTRFVYKIERILARRRGRNGQQQVKVRWLGYPESYDKWINETDIV